MKLVVDLTRCQGYAQCAFLAPPARSRFMGTRRCCTTSIPATWVSVNRGPAGAGGAIVGARARAMPAHGRPHGRPVQGAEVLSAPGGGKIHADCR
jgi:hypothetical protein